MHASRLMMPLLVLAAISSYGCEETTRDSDRVDRIGPSPISFTGIGESPVSSTDFFSRGVTLRPSILTPQRVSGDACPARPPFLVPIGIVAGSRGVPGVFLSQVQMRFTDRTGVAGESITIARPQLVELFGPTSIPMTGTRPFPLSFRFGCLGQAVGTLTVVVFGGDAVGRELRTSLSLPVR